MSTDASGPMAAQRRLTAPSSPAPIRRNAMPRAVRCRLGPDVRPKSKVVSAVGISSDATQQDATAAAVSRAWPALSFSHADAQMAQRINPGAANGTSRLLAHGWSGEVAGRHSTVTITQTAIISGSAQTLAAPRGSRQVRRALRPRRTSAARPNAPSSTAGTPRYQMTQYRLSW